MASEGTQHPDANVVAQNTKRIDKLIHEVEQLVTLLEVQRLVEPAKLIPVKRDLHRIERGA
jgi:hypothetical protein